MGTQAIKLKNGNLRIPIRAESPEGPDDFIADGAIEIGPDHPDYQKWLPLSEEEP